MKKSNMFRKGLVLGIIILFVGAGFVPSIDGNIERVDMLQSEEILEKIASASMFFTKNKGQFPEQVLFQTHAPGATVYLCQDKIVSVFTKEIKERPDMEEEMDQSGIKYRLHLDNEPLQMEKIPVVAKFVDANKDVTVKDEVILPHYNNYFIGNDPDKWYTNVPNYQEVMYKNIYPRIDLRYYYHDSSLKYDFIVHPGADPSVINICYEGVENLRVTPTGDLEIMTCFGVILEKAPLIYQEINGVRNQVAGGYEIREPDVFGFTIDVGFDPLFPLVVDPELVYSTFLGGIDYDNGCDIAVDNEGNAYVTGFTNSDDIPMVNPYDGTRNGGYDVMLMSQVSPTLKTSQQHQMLMMTPTMASRVWSIKMFFYQNFQPQVILYYTVPILVGHITIWVGILLLTVIRTLISQVGHSQMIFPLHQIPTMTVTMAVIYMVVMFS